MDITIPEGMSDAAMLALVVGFVSPLVLNFIVSALWPSWAKAVSAFIFSAIVGVITALVAGAFNGLSILSTVLLVLVVAVTSYQNFWKQVAPNMQRDAAKKEAIIVEEKKAETEAIIHSLPSAQVEYVSDSTPITKPPAV